MSARPPSLASVSARLEVGSGASSSASGPQERHGHLHRRSWKPTFRDSNGVNATGAVNLPLTQMTQTTRYYANIPDTVNITEGATYSLVVNLTLEEPLGGHIRPSWSFCGLCRSILAFQRKNPLWGAYKT